MTCGTQVVGEEEHLLIIKIERKLRRKKIAKLMTGNVLYIVETLLRQSLSAANTCKPSHKHHPTQLGVKHETLPR